MAVLTAERILEADIKAALIDRLIDSGEISGDAILIDEVPIADWSRRVDLVVANGKLQAFEIKSEADSLDRLEGQVENYQRLFDKVTVVCAERFVESILERTRDEVSVLVVQSGDGHIFFRQARRGKIMEVTEPSNILALLRRKDMEALLREYNRPIPSGAMRNKLEELASDLPRAALKRAALAVMKSKYGDVFRAFIEQRRKTTRTSDLEFLRRRDDETTTTSIPEPQNKAKRVRQRPILETNPYAIQLDPETLKSIIGQVPADMPRVVLKRAQRIA
ncbi:MAG: sce7726 family protein [Alphaproteobacteria bacterium]|nr:sce7726 family protein [Alphaproteobacteria bacterium]MBF0354986.1 sce7726 family protein [Alphaproteobacteria bacterium]